MRAAVLVLLAAWLIRMMSNVMVCSPSYPRLLLFHLVLTVARVLSLGLGILGALLLVQAMI